MGILKDRFKAKADAANAEIKDLLKEHTYLYAIVAGTQAAPSPVSWCIICCKHINSFQCRTGIMQNILGLKKQEDRNRWFCHPVIEAQFDKQNICVIPESEQFKVSRPSLHL